MSVVRPWLVVVLAVLVGLVTWRLRSYVSTVDTLGLYGLWAELLAWPCAVLALAFLIPWIRAVQQVRWSPLQVLGSHLVAIAALTGCMGVLSVVPAALNQVVATPLGNDVMCRDGARVYLFDSNPAETLSVLHDPESTSVARLNAVRDGGIRGVQPLDEVTLRCGAVPPALDPAEFRPDVVWYQPGDLAPRRLSSHRGSRSYERAISVHITHLREDYDRQAAMSQMSSERARLAEAWFANGDAVRRAIDMALGQTSKTLPWLLLFHGMVLLGSPLQASVHRGGSSFAAGTCGLFAVGIGLVLKIYFGHDGLWVLASATGIVCALLILSVVRQARSAQVSTTLAAICLAFVFGLIVDVHSCDHGNEELLNAAVATVAMLVLSPVLAFHRNRSTAFAAHS